MFRASLYPSSGEQECVLPHMVFCTVSDVCSCVELGRKLCALWRSLFDFTLHTARFPAPHNHSHHNQCRTPYAAVHIIFLLMMGVMMPETCWDILIINIRLVTSCWSLSLHPKYCLINLHLQIWRQYSTLWFKPTNLKETGFVLKRFLLNIKINDNNNTFSLVEFKILSTGNLSLLTL